MTVDLVISDFGRRIFAPSKKQTTNNILTEKIYEKVADVKSAIRVYNAYSGFTHKQNVHDEVSRLIFKSLMLALNNGATTLDLNASLERIMGEIENVQ